MKNPLTLLAIGCTLLLSSCLKDIEELYDIKGVTANPTIAAPLINSSTSIADIVGDVSDDAKIVVGANNVLELQFTDTNSLPTQQYFTVPDVDGSLNLIMPPTDVPGFEVDGYYSKQLQSSIPISLNGNERLERIWVKDGRINFTVSSTFKHNVTFKITYPGITKNGIALTDSFVFIYNGTTPAPIQRIIDIDDYEIDFTNNGSTYNTFPFEAKIDIIRNPSNTVDLTDNISFNQNLNVSTYRRVEGYFGRFTIAEFKNQNILGVFDKKLDGNVYINDPRLKLRITNSFGMPITARVSRVYVLRGTGDTLDVSINQFKDTFTLAYTSSIDQSRTTEYFIDRNNSNIEDVLSSAPQEFHYEMTFYANYNDVVQTNVLYDYTTVVQEAGLIIPFDLKILNYAIENEGNFSLPSDISDTGTIRLNWLETQSLITNNLPLNIITQIYLVDSTTNTVLDSVYNPPYLIKGAQVDANGDNVAPTTEFLTNRVEGNRIPNFRKANKYRIQVQFVTSKFNTTAPFVRFKSDQNINIKLGVKANGTTVLDFK